MKQYDGIKFELLNYLNLKFELWNIVNIKRDNNYISKENVFSVSFFKLDDGYKPFNVYVKIIKLINNTIKNTKWNLRIYYDSSVLDDKNILDAFDYSLKSCVCELYEYVFPDYI